MCRRVSTKTVIVESGGPAGGLPPTGSERSELATRVWIVNGQVPHAWYNSASSPKELPLTAVAFIIIAVVILAAAIYAIKAFSQSGVGAAPKASQQKTGTGFSLRPEVTDFHVKGDTASMVFNVPLGDSDAGQHLIDLLSLASIEHLRELAADGLPLDGVARIAVSAVRDGEPEQVTVVELPEVGTLPAHSDMSDLHPVEHDPVAVLAAVVADESVKSAPTSSGALEPVSQFLELTGPSEARLRSVGVDTSAMSHSELCRGLLRIGDYVINDAAPQASLATAPDAEVFSVTRAGQRLQVVVLSHVEGDYPEVDDRVLAELAVMASQANVDKVMLITDKFSPYSMYDRERRSDAVMYVTRERLQAFVDSFGLS